MTSVAASRQPSDTPGKLLSIGQVLTRLSAEFPDLAPSKLRYLEEQGLVTPTRTSSGYRKFSNADVDRLRFILSVQRDHYLPLKVIRDYLDEIDRGGSPVLPGLITAVGDATTRVPTFYSREALESVTGASRRLVADTISAGLLHAGDRFDAADVAVVNAIVALGPFGIEPRHLRGIRVSVEREAGLIESATAAVASRSDSGSRAKAERAVAELADLFAVLRNSIMTQVLARKS